MEELKKTYITAKATYEGKYGQISFTLTEKNNPEAYQRLKTCANDLAEKYPDVWKPFFVKFFKDTEFISLTATVPTDVKVGSYYLIGFRVGKSRKTGKLMAKVHHLEETKISYEIEMDSDDEDSFGF